MNQSNFSKQFLCKLSFEGQDLSEADFSCSRLEEVNFRKAILRNANFSSSYILGCDFDEAILTQANFVNSVIGINNVNVMKILISSVFISVIALLFASASDGTFSTSTKWRRVYEWIGAYIGGSVMLIPMLNFLIHSTLSMQTYNKVLVIYIFLIFGCFYLLLFSIRQAFSLAQEVSKTSFCKSDLTEADFKNATIKGVNFSDSPPEEWKLIE